MKLVTVNDLEKLNPVFRGRMGNALARLTLRILSIDKTNRLYERNERFRGTEFARSILLDLGIRYSIGFTRPMETETTPLERLREMLPDGAFITLSNHPYGSIDGIILADLFGHLRPDYKIVVNKMLGMVDALSDIFIKVTPHTKGQEHASQGSVSGIKHALLQLRNGGSLGLFPAGAISNYSLRDRYVRDRAWQEPIIRLIAKAKVPVLPVRFFDGNSPLFYLLGLIDWRMRLLRLPSELFNKSGHIARIGIGDLISVEEQEAFLKIHPMEKFGEYLRERIYRMPPPEQLFGTQVCNPTKNTIFAPHYR